MHQYSETARENLDGRTMVTTPPASISETLILWSTQSQGTPDQQEIKDNLCFAPYDRGCSELTRRSRSSSTADTFITATITPGASLCSTVVHTPSCRARFGPTSFQFELLLL